MQKTIKKKQLPKQTATAQPVSAPDHSTYEAFLTKNGTYRQMRDLYRQERINQGLINDIIDEMDVWVNKPDAFTLEDFLGTKCISWMTFHNWLKKFPDLNDAWQNIKLRLAAKREKGLILGDYHPGAIMYSQRHYSKTWEDLAKSHAQDKQDSLPQTAADLVEVVQYVLEKSPETKEVPHRKRKDA